MKKVFLSILFVGAAIAANAQKGEVSSAKKNWDMFQLVSTTGATLEKQMEPLKAGLANTDKAIANEKSKAMPDAWSLRAVIASSIAFLDTVSIENSIAHQKIAEEAVAQAKTLDQAGKEKETIATAELNITNTMKNRAFNAYNKKDYKTAYQYFNDVAQKNPGDTAMILNAGIMAKINENYPSAIENYKKVIALNSPQSEGLYQEIVDMYFQNIKDTAQGLVVLKEAAAKYPGSDAFLKTETQYYIDKGDYAKSEEMLDKMIAKEPNTAIYHHLKGDVYYKQALASQEQKNKLDPKKVKESDALAKKISELVDKSIPFYEKAIEVDPKFVSSLETLKQIYAFKNNTAKYEEVKKRLDALNP